MMGGRQIQLEKLVGRKVVDSAGKKAGRLEEIIVGRDGLIQEYVLGRQGLAERLGLVGLSMIFWGRKKNGRHVPWEKMDLGALKLKCRLEELDVR